ncbi:MAG: hypothetical protein ACR2KV_00530 [Solirubrobacteraceae bacterium]
MLARPLTVLGLAGVLFWSASAAQASPATPPAGRVSATLDACHAAPNLAARYATFGAQMAAVPGTEQMSIRLELDERTPMDPVFHALSGVPGFGVWKSSEPGIGVFGYSQEVTSLTAPASFRVAVTFRWLGTHHRVIRRARRVTPACVVTAAPAAGLVVGSLSGVAG